MVQALSGQGKEGDLMNKIKIYLDTSVISYLDQKDAPEQMKETQEIWELLKKDLYEIYISDVVVYEINKCSGDLEYNFNWQK